MTEDTQPARASSTAKAGPDVEDVVSEAKAEGRDAIETAKVEADQTAETLRERASETWYDAYETASDRVDAAADGAASKVSQQARAAQAAAGEQPSGSPQQQVLTQASAVLENTAAHLRQTDLDTALADLRGFARRQPTLFLVGAAALGFFAARVARASDPGPRSTAVYPQTHEAVGGVSR